MQPYYKVPHQILEVSSVFSGSKSSLNAGNDIEVSTGDYATQTEVNTEVEFRNGIFISILAGIAMQKELQKFILEHTWMILELFIQTVRLNLLKQ